MKLQIIRSLLFSISCCFALACGNDNGEIKDSGSGNNGTDAGAVCNIEPNFTSLYDNIFNTISCNSAGCHGDSPNGGLQFNESKAAAHAALLADSAALLPPQAKRVVANDINASYLWTRLNALQNTTVMPPAGKMDENCELAMIKAWIENGAPND